MDDVVKEVRYAWITLRYVNYSCDLIARHDYVILTLIVHMKRPGCHPGQLRIVLKESRLQGIFPYLSTTSILK